MTKNESNATLTDEFLDLLEKHTGAHISAYERLIFRELIKNKSAGQAYVCMCQGTAKIIFKKMAERHLLKGEEK